VQVDSANPQRVRIDFNEAPPGQPHGPPHDYVAFGKYQRDFRRQYIVDWTAAVIIVVILYIFFSTR
jgi:hypothetical protein